MTDLAMDRRKVAEIIPWVKYHKETRYQCRATTAKKIRCSRNAHYWYLSLKNSRSRTGAYCLQHMAQLIFLDHMESDRFNRWYLDEFGQNWYEFSNPGEYSAGSLRNQTETPTTKNSKENS
jgi:hypothetical protein